MRESGTDLDTSPILLQHQRKFAEHSSTELFDIMASLTAQ